MPDAKSPTEKRKLTAAERRLHAFERRKGGWTFQRIGDELGITRQAAHQLVTSELRKINDKIAESADELRRMELERLDTMINAIWGDVLRGDLGAIDRVLKMQVRRAALLGLDAPKGVDMTIADEKIIVTIDD